MKNILTDLNNHLFAQLERLSDEELTDEALVEEIGRAKAVSQISKDIIGNAKLALDAEKFKIEFGMKGSESLPSMLESK